MKVVLTQEAISKLELNLFFLLEEQKLPKSKVLEIRKSLLARAKGLSKSPFKGQKEEYLETMNQEHRRIIEKDFKIIYFIESEVIYVTDFFHTHRNPDKMKG